MKIEGDRAWPIYYLRIKWAVPTYAPTWNEHWFKGLPDGLQWNNADTYKMAKKKLSKEEMDKLLQEFTSHIIQNQEDKGKPIDETYLQGTIKFWKYETWVLQWFNHMTFDTGQSDKETLDSFQRYVYRVQKENGKIYRETGEESGYASLMGADERWRWTGDVNGETIGNNRPDPPCRCKYCKEQGVIRINH